MKDKHVFSQEYNMKKENLILAIQNENNFDIPKIYKPNIAIRIFAVAAVILILSVGALAISHLIQFRAEQDGYKVHVNASITSSETNISDGMNDRPYLAWRAENGEIGVKLNFGYMPEDMFCDLATPYKYSNEEFTRAITFIGHDLLINDFDDLTIGVKTERFSVGGKDCYIVYGGEAAFYNKTLYILFAEEKLVVEAIVSYGVSVDELEMIAENLSVSFTEDSSEALPISNERGIDYNPNTVFYSEPNPIYYADMYDIGDTAEHKGYFDTTSIEITIISAEFTDTIKDLEVSNFFNYRFIEKFVDSNGNFVPYARTELVRGDGVNTLNTFGKTEYMTKKMIILTVRLDGKEGHDAESFLNSFSLYNFTVEDNGEITTLSDYDDYVYDTTPGTRTGTHEPVYKEFIGNGVWKLAYILDVEELSNELVWFTTKNAIGENLGYIIK